MSTYAFRFNSATVERHAPLALGLAALQLLACAAHPTHESVSRAQPGSLTVGASRVQPIHADTLFSAGQSAALTGWEGSPERLRDDYCRGCHASVHAAWSAGMHARAWTDPLFEAAFRLEPKPWCRNCHAPLLAQHTGDVALAEGINCAACHVREGRIVGESALSATTRGHAVHAVADFSGAALCAGCHQFQFPHTSSAAMQNTIAEWRASNVAPCGTCHFEGHRWRGPHDPAWLARLVRGAQIEALDGGLSSLRVELAARGHSLPTGDLFHSFVLELSTSADFAQPIASARYGREFGAKLDPKQVSTRLLLRDTTVPSSSPALTLTFDTPAQTQLFARLRYFLHDSVFNDESSRDSGTSSTIWSARLELSPARAPQKN